MNMLVRMLEALCRYIIRHPWRVVILSLIPCVLCMFLLMTTRLNLSFMALVPKEEPLVARYIDIVDNVGLSSQLLLLLLVVLARTSGDRFTLAKATAQGPMDEWWLQRLRQTCRRFVTT